MTDSLKQIKVVATSPVESKLDASLNDGNHHWYHHGHIGNDTLCIVLCVCVTVALISIIIGFVLLRWQQTRVTAMEKLKQVEFDNQMKLEAYYKEQRSNPSAYERSIKDYERLSAIIDKYWVKDERIKKEVGEEKRETVKKYISKSVEVLTEQLMKTIEEMKASK